MNEALIKFYSYTGNDSHGRRINDILEWSNETWDGCHDHIQWLFPLPDASLFNKNAPILDDETLEVFKENGTIRLAIDNSFWRFVDFLGFVINMNGDNSYTIDYVDYTLEQPWFSKADHNHLRITRVLKFMRLVNMNELGRELLSALLRVVEDYPDVIPEQTIGYWERAVSGEPDPQPYFFAENKNSKQYVR
jgi:hypothetical protein